MFECIKCGMPNFSTTLFDTSSSFDTQNRFDALSSLSDPESPVPDNITPTRRCSFFALVQDQNEARAMTAKPLINFDYELSV